MQKVKVLRLKWPVDVEAELNTWLSTNEVVVNNISTYAIDDMHHMIIFYTAKESSAAGGIGFC